MTSRPFWALMATALGLFALLPSCANYRPHYSRDVADWAGARPDPGIPLSHSLYLIGDTGFADTLNTAPALDLLRRKLQREGEATTVLFLGDNLYPVGMAPRREPAERQLGEQQLQGPLEALRGFPGRVFFTPGHYDWNAYGVSGLERQQRYLTRALEEMGFDQEDYFLPEPGCAGPVEVELTEDLVLIFLDSQWWLEDWKGEEEVNADCRVKSRETFRTFFEEAMSGNRAKNIIVALHHPPFSAGPHGGQFTAKQHLFPLTDLRENLWIPLPLLGSLYPIFRAKAGTKQDIIHPEYTALRQVLMQGARRNGSFIFVSGHEHSLQYLEREEQAFVVSGSGSRRTATRISNQARFAYGEHGLARLDVYEDGSVWVTYWVVDEKMPEGRVVFRKKIREAMARLSGTGPTSFPFYEEGQDSVSMPLGTQDYSRSGLGRFMWGEHYRTAYTPEVSSPVFDMATFEGGVVAVKQGGGKQTASLRLEDARGRQFTMRSVAKDPRLLVPHPLHDSRLVLDAIEDSFSGDHPLAATPLPAMQEKLGLYYTHPKLFYVPRQPGLENLNDKYGDALYLVEERPDEEVWREQASFGRPQDIVSTRRMMEKVQQSHHHVVDHAWLLRARLFDNVIGDWDRHDDQWRWSELYMGDSVVYRPIPRDRDHAFSHFDGFLFDIARETFPVARSLRPYFKHMKRIWWANFGARFVDRPLLGTLDWEDWQREVRYIQRELDDETVRRAFRDAWPDTLYALHAPTIIETLKARRDTLMDLARRYYRKLAIEVDVLGTNQRDLFVVERLDDEHTRVRVFDTNREGEREQLLYDRTFLRSETQEVRLYGLQDEDIFEIDGEVGKGILIRVIGGLGDDTFIDRSRVGGVGHKTIVHDVTTEVNAIQLGREAQARFSPDPKYNTYNRHSIDHHYPWWFFVPALGFNPDDGLLLGAGGTHTAYGFKKRPYATKHALQARFAFATFGLEAAYQGEFVDVWKSWSFQLQARYRSPLYATNFYGFGNETLNTESENNHDYHRVRQREYALAPALMRIINPATRLYFGPTLESVRVERTSGRFIDDYVDQEGAAFGDELFDGQTFGGLRFVFDFNNRDDLIFPSQGMRFHLQAGWQNHLNSNEPSFGYLDAEVAGYQPLDHDLGLVLGSRLGFSHRFGNGYPFYQAARLGGTGPRTNLRGFRRDRFTGKTAFFHNTDLRWRFLASNNDFLPFALGAYAGFDYGRVWASGESSKAWHYGYGGGIFFQPLEMFTFQLNAFRGNQAKWRFALMADFLF